MRCVPRKGRQQWVFFLLLVCLLGVYLTYKQLQDSEPGHTDIRPDGKHVEHLQQQLKKRVNGNLDAPLKHAVNSAHIQSLDKKPDVNVVRQGFPAGRALENEDDYVTEDEKLARLKLLLITLSPSNWKTTIDPDEMILLTKSELLDLGIESKLSCREIDNMKSSYSRHQGFYGKKIIDYVQRSYSSDYVLKSVGRDQQLKIECMKMDYREDRCHLMGNYKLVKELVMFAVLNQPSIIKLEGFCLRGETIDPRVRMKGAIIVTEAGKKMQQDLYQLLPWSSKIEIAIQLMKLLLYLENSPIGSLGFEKLQLNDFVMLNSDIKLVDLDNLMIGEKFCNTDNDCMVEDIPQKVISCEEKMCKGRNMMKNLYLLQQSVLSLLFQYSPEGEETKKLLASLQILKLTPKEVLNWLEKRKGGADKVQEMDRQRNVQREIERENRERQQDSVVQHNQDTVQEMQQGYDGKNSYIRQNNANFPAVMTMVMKNSLSGSPDPNYGATLFKKNKRKKVDYVERISDAANNAGNNADNAGKLVEQKEETKVEAVKTENTNSKSCFTKVANTTKSARIRREKRLFIHLGLRGTSEEDWKTYAESTKIVRYLGPSQLASSSVRGGRFRFQFDKNTLGLTKGEFIAEKGPKYYHLAYLASYHLDRVLGLYHIPPTVSRTLKTSEVKAIQSETFPVQKYLNITSDGGLKGLVTVSMPPVMKTSELTIKKRDSLVTEVVEFTRNQKVQVEYILMWALTKMMQPQHGYLGYKGHLIHFEADLAFESLSKSLIGYFYNCQFPNTVYKTLVCYKCPDSKKSSNICGLGFEIVRRIRNSGYTTNEIRVGSINSKDLINIIDSSASAVLQVVEQCIKTFAREKVLY
ncbi:uncharacterized protein LOC132757598 isoform X2 [Ruditapes philippinarum]|uniref:uncharacterized protein LOC132757598 isoform X2 n=1 Tax=Ruditapes philippinarum TaxID=129788 RepID=UPI00295A5AC4|nr:uncharacterized protein LOC132757598 isoform X2 [Ruditapes philippinarum]